MTDLRWLCPRSCQNGRVRDGHRGNPISIPSLEGQPGIRLSLKYSTHHAAEVRQPGERLQPRVTPHRSRADEPRAGQLVEGIQSTLLFSTASQMSRQVEYYFRFQSPLRLHRALYDRNASGMIAFQAVTCAMQSER